MSENAVKPIWEIPDLRVETRTRDSGFLMNGHHCHNCYELFYVHSGKCRHLVEDHFYDLRPGDLILTLGGGDIYRCAYMIVEKYKARENQ